MDVRHVSGLALLTALAVTAALYAPLRTAPFVYEDWNWLPIHTAPTSLVVPGREVTKWTAVGQSPEAAHMWNIGLHLANGALIYGAGWTLGGPVAAAGSALLFLPHPLASEAVAYVTGRHELLMAFFALIAVIAAVKAARAPVAWSAAWTVLAAAAVVGAAASKEMGLIVVPLVALVLMTFTPARPQSDTLRGLLYGGAGVLLGMGWYRISGWVVASPGPGLGSFYDWPTFAALQLTQIGHLLSLAVVPYGLSIDHDVLTLSRGWAWALAAATISAAGLAWQVRTARHALLCAVGWVALCLAPRFVFVTPEFVNERQMYMPLIGLCLSGGLAATSRWPIDNQRS